MVQKTALALVAVGLLLLLAAAFGAANAQPAAWLATALVCIGAGGMVYAFKQYQHRQAGIKNNGVYQTSLTARGAAAWLLALVLTGFYVLLYWFPQLLGLGQNGAANTGLVHLFDPLSFLLKKQPASQWFVYGTLYTLAILVMGFKFMLKYRHNRYQLFRTASVMFFQLGFAFLLPEWLQRLHLPYNDFKNMWPLNYYFFFDWHLNELLQSGNIGRFMLFWGILMVVLVSPGLTWFFGKRWYCSWVCGCGGLAETAGDPFRQLSSKSLRAWQAERLLVYGVLVFALLMTALVLYTWFTGKAQVWFLNSYRLREWYGFLIGAAFSGVIGVGFYPLLGSRVWCRFGCPVAAILGIQQRFFSRFRITANGGQCISCGNCSAYCEMGIDVRWYAQRGQNIVRASCVGCGICAAVCPRGVLKLENAPLKNREALHIRQDGVWLPEENLF
ncbi:4Fe-4S binding protein [Sphingobacteriales bacterium UPWRP_1]|nr:4Fe-4S binding protein [Sphingobacteriales bacterium UPWRP_1]